MIRHIVLIKFRQSVSEEEIFKSLDRIRSLRSVVPGILSIAVGKSESPEKIERGFMHGFVANFSDWDALARYQGHPEHKIAGAELVRLAEGGSTEFWCSTFRSTIHRDPDLKVRFVRFIMLISVPIFGVSCKTTQTSGLSRAPKTLASVPMVNRDSSSGLI